MIKIIKAFLALSSAAANGQLETIKWLLNNGSSIDERDIYNNSCALIAARLGQLETLKWLLENGCSTNDRNINGDSYVLMASKGKNFVH